MKQRPAIISIAALLATSALAVACQPKPTEQPKEAQASSSAPAEDDRLSPSRQVIDWSQSRLTELDAAVAAVEAKSATVKADTREKAQKRLDDLRAARDAYRAKAEAATANAGAWTDAQVGEARRSLDEDSQAFDVALEGYLKDTKADIATRQAVLDAQLRARQESTGKAIEDLRKRAQTLSASERAKADASITALEAQEKDAQQRIGRLRDASEESWQTVKRSSAESRKLFEDTYVSIRQSFEKTKATEAETTGKDR